MTVQEAIKILHPESSFEVLLGCTREEGIKIVEEACLLACEALKKQDAMQRVIERLEERIKILDNTSDINYPSVDIAINETKKIIEIIKEEMM
jgi:hypothetical protein